MHLDGTFPRNAIGDVLARMLWENLYVKMVVIEINFTLMTLETLILKK